MRARGAVRGLAELDPDEGRRAVALLAVVAAAAAAAAGIESVINPVSISTRAPDSLPR